MVEEVKEEDGGSISRGAVLKNMIQREMESSEPVKGFGKPLHRLLQRVLRHRVLVEDIQTLSARVAVARCTATVGTHSGIY